MSMRVANHADQDRCHLADAFVGLSSLLTDDLLSGPAFVEAWPSKRQLPDCSILECDVHLHAGRN
jgi:hypothetical protein